MGSPTNFDRVAREVFAPIYPYYARRIVSRTGVTGGVCLDVGAGSGHLGLALAEITAMTVVLLDNSPDIRGLAARHAAERGLSGRAHVVTGDAHRLPLRDGCVDLVISRGSTPFWHDLPLAFREIRRVLRPEGQACLGGGLGPPEMQQKIQAQMRARDSDWDSGCRRRRRGHDTYRQALEVAGVAPHGVSEEDDGTWVEFRGAAG